jgi:CheY-like chemotaxis protein
MLAPTRPGVLPDGLAYCDAVRTHQHQGMTKHHVERRILSDVGSKGTRTRESSGTTAFLALHWIVDGFRLSRLAERVMEPRILVAVVDDDESVRESLPDLLGEIGLAAKGFASAQEFLASDCIADTRCLILDIAMPGISGPELQHELIRRGHAIPTIFITARSRDSIPPDLFQQGTVECLFKPFSGADLRAALNAALQRT